MSKATKNLNAYGTIPGTWEVAALPKVVFFQEGPGLRKWQWTESGMKVINVTNILGDGKIDTNNTSRFISNEEYEKTYRHFTVDAGDVVIASSGNTYGKVGRISPKDLPLMMNTSVIRFRSSDSEKLDDDFLYAFLRSEVFKRQVESFVIGSAQPNFGPTHLKRMVMPLPPLPIQRRIAGILSAYDKLIENSQRRIQILESMARALYREWFVHFRFPGHESIPRVSSPLGDIPQGWMGTFGQIATIGREGINPSDFPEESFEHFSIPAFDDGCIPAVELGDTILSNKYCIDDSCVLLSKLNPRIPRIWLPSPTGTRRAITSTEFLVLKPRAGFSREFIYAKCCTDQFASQFASLAIGTSTSHQRVKPENLLSMPSAVPDRTVVDQFTRLVAPILAMSEQLRARSQNLCRTRDLLLPRLLSGQIDVEAIAA